MGSKVIAKLRSSGEDLHIHVDFSVVLDEDLAKGMMSDLKQILDEMGLTEKIKVGKE